MKSLPWAPKLAKRMFLKPQPVNSTWMSKDIQMSKLNSLKVKWEICFTSSVTQIMMSSRWQTFSNFKSIQKSIKHFLKVSKRQTKNQCKKFCINQDNSRIMLTTTTKIWYNLLLQISWSVVKSQDMILHQNNSIRLLLKLLLLESRDRKYEHKFYIIKLT